MVAIFLALQLPGSEHLMFVIIIITFVAPLCNVCPSSHVRYGLRPMGLSQECFDHCRSVFICSERKSVILRVVTRPGVV